jgi:hypothetical protein
MTQALQKYHNDQLSPVSSIQKVDALAGGANNAVVGVLIRHVIREPGLCEDPLGRSRRDRQLRRRISEASIALELEVLAGQRDGMRRVCDLDREGLAFIRRADGPQGALTQTLGIALARFR